jgi:hypothetical protein
MTAWVFDEPHPRPVFQHPSQHLPSPRDFDRAQAAQTELPEGLAPLFAGTVQSLGRKVASSSVLLTIDAPVFMTGHFSNKEPQDP